MAKNSILNKIYNSGPLILLYYLCISEIDTNLEKTFEISKNEQIDLSRLTKFLINSGYERADLVVKNGQYAVRGSVIDIFPSNSKLPIRIDLFDDEVISIKYFKNEDQITF